MRERMKEMFDIQLFSVRPNTTKSDSAEFKNLSMILPAIPAGDMDVIRTSYIKGIENDLGSIAVSLESTNKTLKDIAESLRIIAGRS